MKPPRTPITSEEASRNAKARTPVETFDPRLMILLLRAAAGETITFYCTADHSIPAIDPNNSNHCLVNDEILTGFHQLRTLKRRLLTLRKRMFEQNHPRAKDAYRAQVSLHMLRVKPPARLHAKRGTLEIRPQDANLDKMLTEVLGKKGSGPTAVNFDDMDWGTDL